MATRLAFGWQKAEELMHNRSEELFERSHQRLFDAVDYCCYETLSAAYIYLIIASLT